MVYFRLGFSYTDSKVSGSQHNQQLLVCVLVNRLAGSAIKEAWPSWSAEKDNMKLKHRSSQSGDRVCFEDR